jgi:uncharacterized membrane protein YdjX (TVP38/TMEM64 family)
MTRRKVRYLPAGIILAALVLLVVVPFLIFGDALEAWATRAVSADVSRATIAWIGAALLASDVLLPIPASIVSTALGVFLGAGAGTAVSAAGMTAGCIMGFAIGRVARAALVRRLVPQGELDESLRWLERYGVIVLVLCRAVPVLAEVSVIAAGMARQRFTRVFAATTLANVGVSLAYASIGAAAGDLAHFLLAFCLSLALPAVGLAMVSGVRRRRRRRDA